MDDFGMGYALGSESNNSNNGGGWGFGGLGGDGGIWGLLILVLLLGGGRGFGGFGGFGGGGGIGAAELQSSFSFNDLQNGVRGIERGIADSTYALNNALVTGFAGVNGAITESRFDSQQCCCATQKAISDSTTEIIQASNANTQRLIDIMTNNTIQDLRDKLADKDRDVLAANFQLSQLAQNTTLINALKTPAPIPAYQVCSPYQAVAMYDNRCGCGFGNVAGA